MTINQAIEQLFETEDELKTGCLTRDSWAIGMARVGQATQKIVAGPLNKLIDVDFWCTITFFSFTRSKLTSIRS
eukprot:UN01378